MDRHIFTYIGSRGQLLSLFSISYDTLKIFELVSYSTKPITISHVRREHNRPTDRPTDQRTDRPTDRLTEWLIESRARDKKVLLLQLSPVVKCVFPFLPPIFFTARMDKCTKYAIQLRTNCIHKNDPTPCKFCKHVISDRHYRRREREEKKWKSLLSNQPRQTDLHDDWARSCLTPDEDLLKSLFTAIANAVHKIGTNKVKHITITHAYNTSVGNASYGVSIIEFLGHEHKLTFNYIHVGLRFLFDTPIYFYLTLSSIFGSCFELVYLGGIPVLPKWQSDSPARILQFNLATLIRHEMLRVRNHCVAAEVARDIKHINRAEFSHTYWFPAISHHSQGREYYDRLFSLYRVGSASHLRSTMLDWTHRSLPAFIRGAAREDLSDSFPPSGIEPEQEHTSLLSYLSYSTSIYHPEGVDQSRFFETRAQRMARLQDALWPDSGMPALEGESDDEPMDQQAVGQHRFDSVPAISRLEEWIIRNPL